MVLIVPTPKAKPALRLIARIGAWSLATVITVLSLVPAALRPESGTPHDFEHFAIFCATGLAFGLGYQKKQTRVAFALVLFTGAIELAQMLVPDRHARFSDFVVDALAVSIGVALAAVCNKIAAAHRSQHPDEGRSELSP
jgi:VanZ family protein